MQLNVYFECFAFYLRYNIHNKAFTKLYLICFCTIKSVQKTADKGYEGLQRIGCQTNIIHSPTSLKLFWTNSVTITAI